MSTRTPTAVSYYVDDNHPTLYRRVPPSTYERWTGTAWLWSESLHREYWLGQPGDVSSITEAQARAFWPAAFCPAHGGAERRDGLVTEGETHSPAVSARQTDC
jgi:hypothetical protein